MSLRNPGKLGGCGAEFHGRLAWVWFCVSYGFPMRLSLNPIPPLTFDGVSPHHVFVRGDDDPDTVAFVASSFPREDSRRLRLPRGIRELGPR